MKAHMHTNAKGPSKVNSQQVVFELKSKVNLALNKLADRDTYQIGVDELEKTAECLSPDKISPFLSCLLDTDSEQKSAVRKECVRLMATLARFHQALIGPYLNKMVASIVKRLKDPDSVVRDACQETFGVLASKLCNQEDENNGVFCLLVKPLFEALGEQNKQVQSGAALCLARVIDNTHNPPASILQRMLTRTIKLLKNPHLLAKSAVIELNRSIIQAGGATTHSLLAAAIATIQEALKNSDWTTRKAASIALGEIASGGASFLGSFRASCIRSLESCRFDKVKPVRDTVMHAIQYWRSVPGPDTSEFSEAGSYTKENFCGGDYSDITSNSDSGWKDVPAKKVTTNSATRRIPLSVRKTSQNDVKNPQCCKEDDWHIEIAVSENRNVRMPDLHNEESEGSTVTKTLERMTTDSICTQDIGYEFVPMDDKQECSSASNLVSDNFGPKFMTVSHHHIGKGHSLNSLGQNQRFAGEDTSNEEEEVYSAKTRDRRSLDSAVTESSRQTVSGCCSQMVSEIVGIQKQLVEIENKQSNLMDLLQVFSTGIMDSLSMLQSKVLSLENVVDRMAQDLMQGGRHPDMLSSRVTKQSQGVSPRLSSCTPTPRPSVDIRNRPPSLLSVKNSDVWEEKTLGRNRPSNYSKQGMEMWTNHSAKNCRNPAGKDVQKSSRQVTTVIGQTRKSETASAPSTNLSGRQNYADSKNSLWQHVKNLLCEGDLDSAYAEAISSGNELVLMELLDRTGPVLESLSHKTACDILTTLASYLLEQRFMNSIIPWLQQVVDLSSIHGPNHLIHSTKARRELLSAIQETMNMEFSNPAERRAVTQLGMRLHQVWGK